MRLKNSNIQWFFLSTCIILYLFGCGGGGGGEGGPAQPIIGPGDTGNYFPFTQGNIWVFQGTISETGMSPVNFSNTIQITGTKVLNGVATTIFTESNNDNSGTPAESYRLKDSNGITYYGSNDATDTLTPQFNPYQEYKFPLEPASSFIQVDKKGLDYGDDIDSDGISEKVDAYSVVTMKGFETVTVQVATFNNVAKIETNISLTVILSSDKSRFTVTVVGTDWFAPGVGLVKRTGVTTFPDGTSETVIEELIGYAVDGQIKGIMPKFTVASDLAVASSDTESPGKPGIGTDGTTYLVVTSRDSSGIAPTGIIGFFVSGTNTSSVPFPIAQHTCYGFSAAVAFDGTNYLVIFQRYSGGTCGSPEIFGVRVTPSGSVLDAADGFPISPGNESKFSPAVAFDGTNYLVVYGKYQSATLWDIFGARVSPAGVVLDEFPITSAIGDQTFPAIAFDGTNYMVVWEHTPNGSGPSLGTEGTDVVCARISPAGVILDPNGIEIATAPEYQGDAQIAFDGVNYFVVWQDANSLFLDPPVSKIYGRRIKTNGTLLDGLPGTNGLAINTTALSKGDLAVTFNGENYFVVWRMSSFSNDPPSGVYASRVTPEGVLVDSDGLSVSGSPPDFSRFIHPTILSNGTNSLLTWGNNIELYGSRKSLEASFIYPF